MYDVLLTIIPGVLTFVLYVFRSRLVRALKVLAEVHDLLQTLSDAAADETVTADEMKTILIEYKAVVDSVRNLVR